MADNLVATGIQLDTRLMIRAMEQAERRLNALEKQVDQTGKTAKRAEGDLLKLAAGAAAALGSFSAARGAARFIFDTNVQFEQLGARLESITGSARRAEAAFGLITSFAVETPFAVQGLTAAFTTLQAVGISPTKDMLRDLGNFASAMGGNIEDFISAITKAAMGETTQLRERFFQVVRNEGASMYVTFRGVEYQMDRTFQGIVDGYRRISQANFAGAMDKQMNTLAGSISNLEDAAALAAREVGRAGLNQAINELALTLTDAIEKNDEFARTLGTALAAGVNVSTDALKLFVAHTETIIAVSQVAALAVGGRMVGAIVAKTAAAIAETRAARAAAIAQVAVTNANLQGALAQLHMARAMDAGTGSMIRQGVAARGLATAHAAHIAAVRVASLSATAMAASATLGARVLAALGGPVGAAVTAITVLGGAWLLMGRNAEDAEPKVRSMRRELKELAASMSDLSEEGARSHANRIAEHMQQIGAQAAPVAARLRELREARSKPTTATLAAGGPAAIAVAPGATPEEERLAESLAAMQEIILLLQGGFVAAHQRAADAADESAARQKRGAEELAKEFKKLMERLAEQRIELVDGKRAAFEYQMQLEGFGPAQRKAALEVWDAIRALEEKKKADEDAAREAERNRESVARTIESLKQQNIELRKGEEALLRYTLEQQKATEADIQRALAIHRQNEAQRRRNAAEEDARKKREEEVRARMQAQEDQLAQSADRMAGEVTDAFESWVFGSEKALVAVSNMVSGVLREFARLAIRRTIMKPLVEMFSDWLGSAFGGGGSNLAPAPKVAPIPGIGLPSIGNISRITGRARGGPIDAGRPYIVGERGPELVVPRSSGTVIPNGAGGGNIVHQVVQFNITAMDAPAVADLLRSQKATIAQVVGEAARESTGFRAALRG